MSDCESNCCTTVLPSITILSELEMLAKTDEQIGPIMRISVRNSEEEVFMKLRDEVGMVFGIHCRECNRR